MDTATIITSSQEVIARFDKFIYAYPALRYQSKDQDTAFFCSTDNERVRLFYHFKLEDPEYQFKWNYPKENADCIRSFYNSQPFFMIDLSYRSEDMLFVLIRYFKDYLLQHDKEGLSTVLFSDKDFNLIKLEEYL
ncbi:hypothetical protein C8P68_105101 [Mucilaginibacter yixingensis]|uniref:Uncharacterized protein n=1 Tax=Mucilaginibacter yixingensis TaxID=1295612 RepID=A0A2T5J820_9SPHI|nr:hypothetical protein [Mucilaginibacter yixingensis]PTQ95596.1 hypothetical protein C8P68_105101 [Mucilaginibacter yixingensis]